MRRALPRQLVLTKLLSNAMRETPPLEGSYKGYTISGGAHRVYGHDMEWQAAARVWVRCPDNVSIEVERFTILYSLTKTRTSRGCSACSLPSLP